LNILFTFRSFEQLAFALKNKGGPEFTVLNMYFLLFRIFEQLALALKTRVALKIFTVFKDFLSFRNFWATSACPENRVCPEIFQARWGDRPLRLPASYAYEHLHCFPRVKD